MSSVSVRKHFTLKQSHLIELFVRERPIEVFTPEGEPIKILRSGDIYQKTRLDDGTVRHEFGALIKYDRQEKWFSVLLISKDNQVFTGSATREVYVPQEAS